VGTALLWRVLLHYFDPVGCDEWDLRGRPLIRAGAGDAKIRSLPNR